MHYDEFQRHFNLLDPGHAEYTPGKCADNPVFYEYAGNRRVA
ncbi:hypothetical protein J6TS1_01300 [Siminovitchia terrae]|uniref:Uncharacterized protein n=1 Tax=Siminovitchia terrae TaxID=1914933 RepID=A0ABQ4KS07_SIMTE|nr:hypothetical protein J6TS1_01300 [Siminovitchia terrae]